MFIVTFIEGKNPEQIFEALLLHYWLVLLNGLLIVFRLAFPMGLCFFRVYLAYNQICGFES